LVEEKELIYEKPITISNVMKFTIPSTIRMVFISMYSIVDGIIVSNFVGSIGLSAINIVYPVLNICMAFSFMFAAGGNALIGKLLGENKTHKANQIMTSLLILNVAIVTLMVIVFLFYDEPIYYLLGSDKELLPACKEYGSVIVLGGPVWVLQILFQNFLITADRPKLSMYLTFGTGILNVILDFVLVGALGMGLTGAAIASVAGMVVGGLVPIPIFFNKKNLVHFEKPMWNFKAIIKSMGNGFSEMVTNLSCAVTTTLYNWQMMALVGEKGVAAISAALYLQFVFIAAFIGFSNGLLPLISYHYGAKDHEKLSKAYKIGLQVMVVLPVMLFALSEILCVPLVLVFASKDLALKELMIHGFRIMAFGIAFTGISIYASSVFTALNNGRISAIISFLRTFLFEAGFIILLPQIYYIDGVWLAVPVADFLVAIVSVVYLKRYKEKYHY